MDVSADLQELARCPVGLVSAGVKSILDIGRCRFSLNAFSLLLMHRLTSRTLEYLVRIQLIGTVFGILTLQLQETLGVPVISYAKTNDFPAFYTARSGFKVFVIYLIHNSFPLTMHSRPFGE